LGELALLDGRRRSANATSSGPSSLLILLRSEFIPYLKQNPEMAIQLLVVLCDKLRNTSDMVENVGLLPVPSRLARLVLKLARAENTKLPAGMTVELTMSQREMGNLIGTSRESVNKTLSQWQAQGLVRLHQPRLTLLKPRELSLISEALL
jgi:CRP-like cAMP-binding protein